MCVDQIYQFQLLLTLGMQFNWALYRSPLMKTLDWSVETLGSECSSTGLCIDHP